MYAHIIHMTCVCVCVSHSVMSSSLQPHGLQLARLFCPWDSPGKNTRVDCLSLLQGIFLTQGSNPGFQHCRQILYCLSQQGSLIKAQCCITKARAFLPTQRARCQKGPTGQRGRHVLQYSFSSEPPKYSWPSESIHSFFICVYFHSFIYSLNKESLNTPCLSSLCKELIES